MISSKNANDDNDNDGESSAIPPPTTQPQHHNLQQPPPPQPQPQQSQQLNHSYQPTPQSQHDYHSTHNPHTHPPIQYYRITYRGIVALHRHPNTHSPPSGAYVSYGEIVASTYQTDTSPPSPSPPSSSPIPPPPPPPPSTTHPPDSSPSSSSWEERASSIAPSSVTSASLPLGPSLTFRSMCVPPKVRTRPVSLVVRVDEVLTGGYALDALAVNNPSSSSSLDTSASSEDDPHPCTLSEDDPTTEPPPPPQNHGYLFPLYQGIPIAEPIPSPPLLCQAGTFFYRVVSRTPLPIIAGPCADAPLTRGMALPGTMFEVSLRMGTVPGGLGGRGVGGTPGCPTNGYPDGSGSCGLLEDGVVYLRLSHRRGWIADRRIVRVETTEMNGGSTSIGNHGMVVRPPWEQPGLDPCTTLGGTTTTSSPSVSLGGAVSQSNHHHRIYNRNNASSTIGSDTGSFFSQHSQHIPQIQTKTEIVASEITHLVDLSVVCGVDGVGCSSGGDDAISLGGSSSVSSAAVNTPLAVLRRRRRPRSSRRNRGRPVVLVGSGSSSGSVGGNGEGSGGSEIGVGGGERKVDGTLRKVGMAAVGVVGRLRKATSGTGKGKENRSKGTDGSDGRVDGDTESETMENGTTGRSERNKEDRSRSGSRSRAEPSAEPSAATTITTSSSSSSSKGKEGGKGTATRPTVFLNRVRAPNGLKLLDASHFQVNNLIRGQSNSTSMAFMKDSESHKSLKNNNPSSIFQTMTSTNSYSTTTSHLPSSLHYYPTQNGLCGITSGSTTATLPARSWEFDSGGRGGRILPHGVLFETSKRLEKVGNFTPGSGLLKLADGTGWAIIPTKEELDEQYDAQRSGVGGSGTSSTINDATTEGVEVVANSKAYEEVGHAVVVPTETRDGERRRSQRTPPPSVWMRIVPTTGVRISCAPMKDQNEGGWRRRRCGAEDLSYGCGSLAASSQSSCDTTMSPVSSSLGGGGSGGTAAATQEVESSSTVGSVFFDAFRYARRSDTNGSTDGRGAKLVNKMGRTGLVSSDKVIPCGTPVEVESWNSSQLRHEKTHFVKLCNNRGWIPRKIHGNAYSTIIPPPQTRQGSLWFRVRSQLGIVVRTGPSRRAPSIRSDDGAYFRFECGEFLRASEIFTIEDGRRYTEEEGLSSGPSDRGSSDSNSNNDDNTNNSDKNRPSHELFARLFRNTRSKRGSKEGFGENDEGDGDTTTSSSDFLLRGEWVHVTHNNTIYLEECKQPPAIQRHHEGRRYDVAVETSVEVRKGPCFDAEKTGAVLRRGDNVLVNERVTAGADEPTWLRLKDGRGWVHDTGDDGETIMTVHCQKKNGADGTYNSLIARLFNSEISSKIK